MIETRQLSIRLGEFDLRDISFQVQEGEYYVILGPTGAGKTVLLECIAGILRPDHGTVWIGGHDVTGVPPERRNVGYLPQDHALFPHLTARENLAFGLHIRGRQADISAKVADLSEMLGIGHLLDRFPATLSGGEKQRTALGRALAVDPVAILLDEPLSALDVATRERIGDELRNIRDRTGVTIIHICHDFEETLRLADSVALVRDGRICQVGTPEDIMRRPMSPFAATFVRSENMFTGVCEGSDGAAAIRIGEIVVRSRTRFRGAVHVTIRPDDIMVSAVDDATATRPNTVLETVQGIEHRGYAVAVRMSGSLPLTASMSRSSWSQLGLGAGDPVLATVSPESVHAFPMEESEGTRET